MPNYFNVKNNTYSTNRFMPLLPVVPLLLLRSKNSTSINQSTIASQKSEAATENNTTPPHSIIQSIGSIFSGSNALDILSSVEPYLDVNSQQLVHAIKALNRSVSALKAYRSSSVSTTDQTQSADSLDLIKALSSNFNPNIKNSISPILNLISTIQGVQSTAPALQQMLSSNGLAKILSNFSSMIPTDAPSSLEDESEESQKGTMGLSEMIRMITALNTMKTSPAMNLTPPGESEPKLLEAETIDDSEKETDENQSTDETAGSLIDMAEKIQDMIKK